MKVRFDSDPVTRLVVRPPAEARGRRHQVVEPWVFHVDASAITVPPGFWTDWASIPRLARAILDRDGPWARAALAHDFLYFITYRDSRAVCDSVLYQGMVTDGVAMIYRNLIYYAVRIGGGFTWAEYKANRYHAAVSLAKMPTKREGMQFAVTVAAWDRGVDDALA